MDSDDRGRKRLLENREELRMTSRGTMAAPPSSLPSMKPDFCQAPRDRMIRFHLRVFSYVFVGPITKRGPPKRRSLRLHWPVLMH